MVGVIASAIKVVVENVDDVTTIQISDLVEHGCPYCNFKSCHDHSLTSSLPSWECCNSRFCKRSYIVVANGATKVNIMLNGQVLDVGAHPKPETRALRLEYLNPDQIFGVEALKRELVSTRLLYEDALDQIARSVLDQLQLKHKIETQGDALERVSIYAHILTYRSWKPLAWHRKIGRELLILLRE